MARTGRCEMTLFWTLSILGAILGASSYAFVVMLRWGGESRQEERLAAAVRAYDQLEREAEWRSR